MLNAKKARELADTNKNACAIAEIEKQIKKAIEKGRDYIITMTCVTETVEETLKNAGYKVAQQMSGTKISW